MDKKAHWEKIYATKANDEVSWYQPLPKDSLDLITNSSIELDDPIIDVGAGNSFLVDYLLKKGFTNITVLDISKNAINKAKKRLGVKAELINWVVTDILDFKSEIKYKLWHDRAVFHFLTDQNQIKKYVDLVSRNISNNGYLIIGTFSEQGPLKCSGLEVSRYSESLIKTTFIESFTLLNSFKIDHSTPFNTTQNFLFSVLKKISV